MQIGVYVIEPLPESTGAEASPLSMTSTQLGFFTVYAAHHAETSEPFTLTVFAPHTDHDATLWMARIQALRTIVNPHLIPFKTGGKTPEGAYYLTSPRYDRLLQTTTTLPLSGTLKLVGQIANALDAIHASDQVHGRVSAEQVFKVDRGSAALGGLEVIAEATDLAPTDDIRALARLTHRILTGREVSDQGLDPQLPRPIASVLRAALTPESGFLTAGELAKALQGASANLPPTWRYAATSKTATGTILTTASTTAIAAPPARSRSPLPRPLIALLVVASLIAAAIVALLVYREVATASAEQTIALARTQSAQLEIAAEAKPATESRATPSAPNESTIAQTGSNRVVNSSAGNGAASATPSATLTATVDDITAVPAVITDLPSLTPTETTENTATGVPTTIESTPTASRTTIRATMTLTATLTLTATEPPTASPSGLVTATPRATLTPSITFTPSITPIPPSATPTPSLTPTVTLTLEFTYTPTVSAAEKFTSACIDVVGDSVTAGTGVYEVPGIGYAFIQAAPVSSFLTQRLKQTGVADLTSVNRGAPNTGISSINHPSFFATQQYADLLNDHCRYTVIMPWINDISPTLPAEQGAARHASVLGDLVTTIVANNPYGRILVLNYYRGRVSPFAKRTWAIGFNLEGTRLFNQAIADSCSAGALSALPQVTCVDISTLFDDMDGAHVIGLTTNDELNQIIIEPPKESSAEHLRAYFSGNPQGQVLGDGVHLSPAGKKRLARFLIDTIQNLPPPPDITKWVQPVG